MSDEKSLKYNEPWILQRADPYVYRHTDGSYYFTASVPAYDGIVLRRAGTLAELSGAEEVMVWKKHESGPMGTGDSLFVWKMVYLFCGRRGGRYLEDPSICVRVQRGRSADG